MENGKPKDIPIREGEVFLLPPKVPHSPQRKANTVGLVLERKRLPHEKDGFVWFCPECHHKLYEETIQLIDIETDLPRVFDRFYGNRKNTTCTKCGTQVMREKAGNPVG